MSHPTALSTSLKTFLVEQLFIETPVEEIGDDAALGSELGVDSLGFTEIVAFLEDTHGIKITDEEFSPENFRTIAAICALVRRKGVAAEAA